MKLTLVNCQSEEEITLDCDSPVIIGRRPEFGCFDKKVSRNHGQLKLTPDGSVHLIALHSNPCFVMKNGLPPIIPVLKSDERILNDGDFVGLLPDSFWYKVVVDKNECVNVPDTVSNNSKSDSVVNEDCNMAETTVQIISENDADNSKESQPGSSQEGILSVLVPENDKNVAEKMNSSDSLEERLKALEHTKKLPLYMYEIDDFPEESGSADVKEEPPNVVKEKEETSEQCNTEENEECVNRDSIITSTSEDNSESHTQFESRTTGDISPSEGSASSSESIKENVPHTSKDLDVNEQKKNCNNSQSSDGSDSKERTLCQYEGRCYRKNSEHRRDYCHPGDPDFVPYENRPVCQYGASCYRKNKMHHVEYRHLKKRTRATDSPQGKRRRKEVQYRHTSDEDDYDLEDPFIDDGSSDEFIPTNSDSDEEMEDFTE